MDGLGLLDFLTHETGPGGRQSGDWLRFWKKDPGKIVVWLHPAAKLYPVWRTVFPSLSTFELRKTGKVTKFLRWTNFVGWDPAIVYEKQRWYDDKSGEREVPPVIDPFQLLKEWLRGAKHIDLDAPIFRWVDPEDEKVIEWTRGQLSGLKERGKKFGHSIDAKLEWLFTVVDHANPEKGPLKTWVRKSLGEKMQSAIRKRIERLGDVDGNPIASPVAFVWTYNASASTPNDYYEANDVDRIKITDEVKAALLEVPPDPTEDVTPDASAAKTLQAIMEEAAVVDLPWDHLFKGFEMGEVESRARDPREKRTPAPTTESTVDPDDVDMEPCEACGCPFPSSETKCPSCGTEYEDVGDVVDRIMGPDDSSDEDAPAAAPQARVDDDSKCWVCAQPVTGGKCTACGTEQGQDIPFG